MHAHQIPVSINPCEADELVNEIDDGVAVGRIYIYFHEITHLLSRQQIHSADGDEFRDVCTATIFPGFLSLRSCRRRRLPGGYRWSLMNVSSGCAPLPHPHPCLETPHTTTGCSLHCELQMTCIGFAANPNHEKQHDRKHRYL